MEIARRSLLSGTAAAGLLWPVRAARAQAAVRPALPIPPELKANEKGEITVVAQAGTQAFLPGVKTQTFGFNGPFLGPAIRVRRGEAPVITVTNRLDETITSHWHGLIIPGVDDGGPYRLIGSGESWRVKLPIAQPAATLWFHPHIYPVTAELVIKGLAGLFIIDDEESDALPLPSSWGIDDIPVIIQDRRFTPDGQFFHRFNPIAIAMGYVGDQVLVNGAIGPVARTGKGWLRLRILNGSNARNYRLGLSDQRDFYVIATDGGLLEAPVRLNSLPIAAGERFEILIDARDGKMVDLVSIPVAHQPIMRLPPFDETASLMTLDPSGVETNGQMPDRLVSLPPVPQSLPPVSQNLVMQMYRDKSAKQIMRETGLMQMAQTGKSDPAIVAKVVEAITQEPAVPLKAQLTANGINGAPFSFIETGFHAPINTDLVWSISEETDQMLHPVHIHGCQFRIAAMDGKPPPAFMAGWKDTVPIENGGNAHLFVRFPCAASADNPYMAHCHNLEHEDSGMMTEFSVG